MEGKSESTMIQASDMVDSLGEERLVVRSEMRSTLTKLIKIDLSTDLSFSPLIFKYINIL